MNSFFFGNYFYGLCAVALSIEASLQQRFPLNPIHYYFIIFLGTVVFYTKAYIHEKTPADDNPRTRWYITNKLFLNRSQLVYSLLLLIAVGSIGYTYFHELLNANLFDWFLILIFPLAGILYYGAGDILSNINLRRIGWLKPFAIGFVWSGLVTVYPVLYFKITHGEHYMFTFIGFLLFIKNLMFIAMLCVLFDIKDYATDSNQRLKTLVVKFGLRKTIFSFVIPLTIIGLGSFLLYGFTHNFHPIKILLNTIPFLSLILVAYSMHKPKSILYYLILIDGLMLVKAVCGSVAMNYF